MGLNGWLASCPVIPILRGVQPDEVAAIAAALEAAGRAIVEVPLNAAEPRDGIARLARTAGDRMLVGAGTVMTPEQVAETAVAGGRLIVMPHADVAVTRAAKQPGLLAIPGFFTPAEGLAMRAAGADALTLFPAGATNPAMLRARRTVFPPPHDGAARGRHRRGRCGRRARPGSGSARQFTGRATTR